MTASPIRALLLGENSFPFHRFDVLAPLVADALRAPDVDVLPTTDRDALLSLDEYDVVVDYTTDCTFSDEQLDGLLAFVEDGGGYVGLHSAADLTTTVDGTLEEPQPELRELLGGHFLGHPSQSRFSVAVVDSHHSITAGLDASFSVWDEPYDLSVDADDVRVLARMDHPELADTPVAWTKSHGDGRVFYCSLGHDRPTYDAPAVGQLLRGAVRWAADA